jgi:hypothetical protein
MNSKKLERAIFIDLTKINPNDDQFARDIKNDLYLLWKNGCLDVHKTKNGFEYRMKPGVKSNYAGD